MIILNIPGVIVEPKQRRGNSIKINGARLCNVKEFNSKYEIMCRSKLYAEALPVPFRTTKGYNGYGNYWSELMTLSQLTKWVEDIIEIGIERRLDGR